MSTDAETARGRRVRPPGALLFIVLLGVAIFLVSRGCQSEGIDISQEEAVAIARQQIDYAPDEEQVRIIRRGLNSKPHWAVGFARHDETGSRAEVATVIIDAETAEVVEVRVDGRRVPVRDGEE